MRLRGVLVCVALAVTSATSSTVSVDSNQIKLSKFISHDASSTACQTVDLSKRLLSSHESREAKSGFPAFSDITEFVSRNDEERAITPTEFISKLGDALMAKAKLKAYLFFGVKPDKVHSLMKVVNREDDNYRHYATYFFQYYVKYLDEPLSHLPPKTVEQIMKARLHTWLYDDLTPPQVFANLKLKGFTNPAPGQENIKYFNDFQKMWGKKQARESKLAQ
ncbi:hypothetical protein PRIC2_014398 [Phytophthora ramorum]